MPKKSGEVQKVWILALDEIVHLKKMDAKVVILPLEVIRLEKIQKKLDHCLRELLCNRH